MYNYARACTQTLDLKGREKFLDQQSVQSYMGCSHCTVNYPKGVKGPTFGVARRYLPPGHSLRRQVSAPYEYPAPEALGKVEIAASKLAIRGCLDGAGGGGFAN